MRLEFFELGMAIGLAEIELVADQGKAARLPAEFCERAAALSAYASLSDKIVPFRLDAEHRRQRTWRDHQDIDQVMLASALVAEGCMLPPARNRVVPQGEGTSRFREFTRREQSRSRFVAQSRRDLW
ncbi:MAG TPA: hypothetical protein VGK20_16360 [Candidatus Binatia bacterium]|jgi:hypothetical protein